MKPRSVVVSALAKELGIGSSELVTILQIWKPELTVTHYANKLAYDEADKIKKQLRSGDVTGMRAPARKTLLESIRKKGAVRAQASKGSEVLDLFYSEYSMRVSDLACAVGRPLADLIEGYFSLHHPKWGVSRASSKLSGKQLLHFYKHYTRNIVDFARDVGLNYQKLKQTIESSGITVPSISSRSSLRYLTIHKLARFLAEEKQSSADQIERMSYADRRNICSVFIALMVRSGYSEKTVLSSAKSLEKRLGIRSSDSKRLHGKRASSADPVMFAKRIKGEDARHMVLWDLLALSVESGAYDSRTRVTLKKIAEALSIPPSELMDAEAAVAEALHPQLRLRTPRVRIKRKKWWLIAGVAVAAGTAAAYTGGLAAPAIGGVIGTYFLGYSGAAAVSSGLAALGGIAGGGTMAAGTTLVASLFGAAGAAHGAKSIITLTGPVKEFKLEYLGGAGLHIVIGVSGFLSQDRDLRSYWSPLLEAFPDSECYALRWESNKQVKLGKLLLTTSGKITVQRWAVQAARRGSKVAAKTLGAPAAVFSAVSLVKNPWHTALLRSEESGKILAENLRGGRLGRRPVTLVGFSLGSRLIMKALESLSETESEGIINDAILMGAAVSGSRNKWAECMRVVAGRMVNVFSRHDIVLSYLYRIAQVTGNEPAGMRAMHTMGVEDYDASSFLLGHTKYPENIPRILDEVIRVDQ